MVIEGSSTVGRGVGGGVLGEVVGVLILILLLLILQCVCTGKLLFVTVLLLLLLLLLLHCDSATAGAWWGGVCGDETVTVTVFQQLESLTWRGEERSAMDESERARSSRIESSSMNLVLYCTVLSGSVLLSTCHPHAIQHPSHPTSIPLPSQAQVTPSLPLLSSCCWPG